MYGMREAILLLLTNQFAKKILKTLKGGKSQRKITKMNDSQSYHMKRSFKYICFQNSAHHFDNMSTLKHCVDDKLDKHSAVY